MANVHLDDKTERLIRAHQERLGLGSFSAAARSLVQLGAGQTKEEQIYLLPCLIADPPHTTPHRIELTGNRVVRLHPSYSTWLRYRIIGITHDFDQDDADDILMALFVAGSIVSSKELWEWPEITTCHFGMPWSHRIDALAGPGFDRPHMLVNLKDQTQLKAGSHSGQIWLAVTPA